MSEEMKSKIIKYAMRKIGTQGISIIDGMTLEYDFAIDMSEYKESR